MELSSRPGNRTEFDPRPWNLLAGLALAACSPKIASSDGESSDSTIGDGESTDSSDPESSDSSTDDDSSTGDGDGDGDDNGDGDGEGDGDGDDDCDDVECPPGYNCYDGDCYYYDPCLGHCCQGTDECDILEVCELSHCYGVDSLPAMQRRHPNNGPGDPSRAIGDGLRQCRRRRDP